MQYPTMKATHGRKCGASSCLVFVQREALFPALLTTNAVFLLEFCSRLGALFAQWNGSKYHSRPLT